MCDRSCHLKDDKSQHWVWIQARGSVQERGRKGHALSEDQEEKEKYGK